MSRAMKQEQLCPGVPQRAAPSFPNAPAAGRTTAAAACQAPHRNWSAAAVALRRVSAAVAAGRAGPTAGSPPEAGCRRRRVDAGPAAVPSCCRCHSGSCCWRRQQCRRRLGRRVGTPEGAAALCCWNCRPRLRAGVAAATLSGCRSRCWPVGAAAAHCRRSCRTAGGAGFPTHRVWIFQGLGH